MTKSRPPNVVAFPSPVRDAPAAPKDEPSDFEGIYRKYVGFVLRQLRRFGVTHDDEEDAAQEVFVTIHRRLDDYDPARATLGTWIYGITRGVAANRRRLAQRRGAAHEEATRITPVPAPGPDAEAERRQLARAVEAFLEAQSQERRAVFELVDIEGFSHVEAAAMLEMNVNTVSTRLRAVRRDFRTHLAEWRQSRGGDD